MSKDLSVVREGWIALLNRYTWDWFVTMTFREATHPESADKRWRLWVSMINRQLYGPRWYKKKKSVLWIRALELQTRGVIHYHALMSHPQDLNVILSRFAEMENLNTIAGFARIFPPRSMDAVINYCSKYVVKGGEIECSPFLPTWNALGTSAEMKHNFNNQVTQQKESEALATKRQVPEWEHAVIAAAEQRKQDLESLETLFK